MHRGEEEGWGGKAGKGKGKEGRGRAKKERIWTFYLAKRNPVDVRGKVQLHDE